MKKITATLILIFICVASGNAQDVIVKKSDESEIKCTIVSLTDTVITYRLYNSSNDTVYTIKRYEVLSFFTGTGTKTQVKPLNENSYDDLLGRYHIGKSVPGLVILSSGDTLTGTISVRNVARNQTHVLFTGSDNKTQRFGVNDLKGYEYDNLVYQKIKTGYNGEVTNGVRSTDGYHFLHLEVAGPARLYRFYTLKFKGALYNPDVEPPFYYGKLKTHYVIIHPSGKQIFTKGRTIKGTLNRIFEDNTELLQQVRRKGPKKQELPTWVRSYNSWYEKQNR